MASHETCLVIGSGSIAKRHISNVHGLVDSYKVACVSASGRLLHESDVGSETIRFSSLQEALLEKPAFAIVASPAPWHAEHASLILKSGIPVLIEKPLSDSFMRISEYLDVFKQQSSIVDVAYNLRFMPSAIKLKALLDKRLVGKIQSVAVDVGQYLPDWRPQSDYRENVSAKKDLGGGVILELSHELDYLNWFFGGFESVYCTSRNTGSLEIDVEDTVDALLMHTEGWVANVHMDFLQRSPVRTCKVVGHLGTLVWDLLANSIHLYSSKGGKEVLHEDPLYNRNEMYLKQIEHFIDVTKSKAKPTVGLGGGLKALRLIEAMKSSAFQKKLINIRGE